ncbi:MAG: Na/Pi symporter [Proteobacteria bacterium]|nr:Na/Pi symporter [Pseudomonadota bacterium]MBU1717364.1 Na/Pi symporter [Pseudomonadota bacterium]
MINETFDLWQLLAGLGIFLFGMYLLEDSIKALSGKAFRRMISNYTRGKLRAIGSGTLITGVLQSSSAVSLIVLAFVGAGVMSMENAIAVMIGANVGTTFNAWIVAFFGFKLKIDSFAFPFIGIAGIGLIFSETNSRLFNLSRLLIGFGFLFLGLNYMKLSVEGFSQAFDLSHFHDYGLWFYLLLGTGLTAMMQASSATIAITLTALHSQLLDFNMAVAMVIGANIGTTITVLLGSLGKGVLAKKIVGISHLVFNLITGFITFLCIAPLTWLVGTIIDINSNSVMALALFHTIFNVIGVIVFYPFIGLLARTLLRIYPYRKTILTAYLDRTPVEVIEAASAALVKEISHLLEECQLYNLRVLEIDEKLVFSHDLPFKKIGGKRFGLDQLYANIKLLHAEIFAYYAKLQANKLEVSETHNLEKVIFASRNIMNSIKNFKGIKTDFDEFDGSSNLYLNEQYRSFRRRLLAIYHEINEVRVLESREEQYHELLRIFLHIEEADKDFIRETIQAVADNKISGIEISSLLLVNRLFTQGCRLQVFGIKDLLLTQEQINDFDRALDMKALIEEEKPRAEKSEPTEGPPEN